LDAAGVASGVGLAPTDCRLKPKAVGGTFRYFARRILEQDDEALSRRAVSRGAGRAAAGRTGLSPRPRRSPSRPIGLPSSRGSWMRLPAAAAGSRE